MDQELLNAVKAKARILTSPGRIELSLEDGIVLVGSDGHYHPGPPTTAHRAFVKFTKMLKPNIIVMNGDAFDGASISRFPSIMWENKPTVQEELEVVNLRLREIEAEAPGHTLFTWPIGNHDQRMETRLAAVAPEYKGVLGFHLKDHVSSRWLPCWSTWINDVVIKHRCGNGPNAVRSAALNSGKSMITGHLHSLKVIPVTDYSGTRWGVDTGCLADPSHRAFSEYTEDGPKDWRSGFVVLTFRDGKMLWPEVVHVHDQDHVDFRGGLLVV